MTYRDAFMATVGAGSVLVAQFLFVIAFLIWVWRSGPKIFRRVVDGYRKVMGLD